VKPISIIQIGLGSWGQNWIRDVLAHQRAVDVVAYVDRDAGRLDAARRRFDLPKGRCFRSLHHAFQSVDAEAVLVTTTMGTHVPVIEASLAAGKHVLTEKPFAACLKDAHEMVALAEERGRVLMVSQNYRWFPAVRAVQDLLAQGRLGAVQGVSLDFRKPPGRDPRQGPSRVLVDMGIHHLDLLRAVLRLDLAEVTAMCVDRDWRAWSGEPGASLPLAIFALLRYGESVPVSYRFSWLSHDVPTTWGGDWSIECAAGQIRWTSRGDDGAAQDDVIVRRAGEAAEMVRLPELAHTGRSGCLHAFVEAIITGCEPETSGRDNLKTLEAMDALVAAVAPVAPGTPVELGAC